ncbi:MAG: hypothetical protein AMXMBFR61_25800 [Fimbriimonadales bacterium]
MAAVLIEPGGAVRVHTHYCKHVTLFLGEAQRQGSMFVVDPYYHERSYAGASCAKQHIVEVGIRLGGVEMAVGVYQHHTLLLRMIRVPPQQRHGVRQNVEKHFHALADRVG